MDYQTFIKEYIAPYVKTGDKPYNRQLFSLSLDMAHKEGIITQEQADRWIYPKAIVKAKF